MGNKKLYTYSEDRSQPLKEAKPDNKQQHLLADSQPAIDPVKKEPIIHSNNDPHAHTAPVGTRYPFGEGGLSTETITYIAAGLVLAVILLK
jgi:hypothetical protein